METSNTGTCTEPAKLVDASTSSRVVTRDAATTSSIITASVAVSCEPDRRDREAATDRVAVASAGTSPDKDLANKDTHKAVGDPVAQRSSGSDALWCALTMVSAGCQVERDHFTAVGSAQAVAAATDAASDSHRPLLASVASTASVDSATKVTDTSDLEVVRETDFSCQSFEDLVRSADFGGQAGCPGSGLRDSSAATDAHALMTRGTDPEAVVSAAFGASVTEHDLGLVAAGAEKAVQAGVALFDLRDRQSQVVLERGEVGTSTVPADTAHVLSQCSPESASVGCSAVPAAGADVGCLVDRGWFEAEGGSSMERREFKDTGSLVSSAMLHAEAEFGSQTVFLYLYFDFILFSILIGIFF